MSQYSTNEQLVNGEYVHVYTNFCIQGWRVLNTHDRLASMKNKIFACYLYLRWAGIHKNYDTDW